MAEDSQEAGVALAVTTRARKKEEMERESQKCIQEEVCGVQPSPLDEEDPFIWMRKMDGDLFG